MALYSSHDEMENPEFFISPNDLTVDNGYKDFLGKGAFGKVFRCYRQDTASTVAVKMFDITGSRSVVENTLQLVRKEMEMLLYLHESPRVVNLIGVTRVDDCMFGLVMEYLPGGCLFDLISKVPIPWILAARMMFETAVGLSYLHRVRFDMRITHNDLKPENILFDEKFHVKLCDFGGSNLAVHSSGKLSRTGTIPSNVYSINYVAPEYLSGFNATRTRAMDVYSYGMILFFVLFKKPAFHNYDSATITYFLNSGIRPKFDTEKVLSTSRDSTEKKVIELLLSQLKRCSDFNPKNRPRIDVVESELEAVVSQFDKDALITLEKLLSEKVPLLEAGLTENRIKLHQKCKSIFVKKLEIPFDINFGEEEYEELKQFCPRDVNEVNQLHAISENEFRTINEKDNPVVNVKATTSSSKIVVQRKIDDGKKSRPTGIKIQGSCSPATDVITIKVDGNRLRKGDKFLVK